MNKTLLSDLRNLEIEFQHDKQLRFVVETARRAIAALSAPLPEEVEQRANRLVELSHAVSGDHFDRYEFSMSIPADPRRDADIVLADSANLLRSLARQVGELEMALRAAQGCIMCNFRQRDDCIAARELAERQRDDIKEAASDLLNRLREEDIMVALATGEKAKRLANCIRAIEGALLKRGTRKAQEKQC